MASLVYVDADSSGCHELQFNLKTGVNNVRRGWKILVTQFACDHPNLAPPGCTQYFYGQDTGVVKTFNYDGGLHLAKQNQKICVRRERGVCGLCWSPVVVGDFALSGHLPAGSESGHTAVRHVLTAI